MTEHKTEVVISSYMDGTLDADEAQGVALHLSVCTACREQLHGLQEIKLRLSRMPRHEAPPSLIRQLKRTYVDAPRRSFLAGFFQSFGVWRPVGVAALAALLLGFWIRARIQPEPESVNMDALLAAHSRYEAEALVPPGDMVSSNYSAKLAAYYADED